MNNQEDQDYVIHSSSVYPWTGSWTNVRECASLLETGYEVGLIPVNIGVSWPDVGVVISKVTELIRYFCTIIRVWKAFFSLVKTNANTVDLHNSELISSVLILRAIGKEVISDPHKEISYKFSEIIFPPRYLQQLQLKVLTQLPVFSAKVNSTLVIAEGNIVTRYPQPVTTRNYHPLRVQKEASLSEDQQRRLLYIFRGNGGHGL